jgi:hypothetical protein
MSKNTTRKTRASLVEFIKKGLEDCSLEKYMGLNLPKGKHTTLGDSARNDIGRQLREDRKETKKLLENIRKTCNLKAYYKLLA